MFPLSPRPPQPPALPGFVLGHRPALDGLRGLAVLAVVAHHTSLAPGGFLGVDVFFVLSGFLITALLLQEHQRSGHIRLSRFYLRRGLRLLPALVGVLAFVWLWTLATGTRSDATVLGKDSFGVLLYYYNWRLAFARLTLHAPSLCHLWSLSVEEQFYLVWPAALVVLLALRARRRWLLAVVLAGMIGPAVLRWCFLGAGCDPRQLAGYMRLYVCSDMRADALSAGCLVALLAAWGVRPTTRWARFCLGAAAWLAAGCLAAHLLLTTPGGSPYAYRWGFTLVALSAAILIASLLWAPPWPLAKLLEARPLGWVGRISYGAYLWNLPVLLAIIPRPDLYSRPRVVAVWVVTLAAGAMSHFCLELPFLRLKQWLDRRESGTSAVVGSAARAA